MDEEADVLVVGAGAAGVGVAAALAPDARVVVLEREPHPGSHATGRSAAILIDGYGGPTIRALTALSRVFYESADPLQFGAPLLAARGELLLARPGEEARVGELAADTGLPVLAAAEARALVPILADGAVACALWDEAARDVDVDLLLQGWLRTLRAHGGRLVLRAEARALARSGATWRVETPAGVFRAPILVNAAGAWGDEIARRSGVDPLGLVPMRRSAALLPQPARFALGGWPLFGGVGEDWYARPMGGKLMVSPADEEPVEPHDAWADDMTLAEGLARFEAMTTTPVTRVERSWAGLRTFLTDRTPACGFDRTAEGFFWLVGQGGYGIQTAPALSALAADLVLGRAADPALSAALSPSRATRDMRRAD